MYSPKLNLKKFNQINESLSPVSLESQESTASKINSDIQHEFGTIPFRNEKDTFKKKFLKRGRPKKLLNQPVENLINKSLHEPLVKKKKLRKMNIF